MVVVNSQARASLLKTRISNKAVVDDVIGRCTVGDWLLLDLLGRNFDSSSFKEVIGELAAKMQSINRHDKDIPLVRTSKN